MPYVDDLKKQAEIIEKATQKIASIKAKIDVEITTLEEKIEGLKELLKTY